MTAYGCFRNATIALVMFVGCCAAAEAERVPVDRNQRYRLQPGDSLDLIYRYTPEFNQTVTVQPDGHVTLTLSMDVRVGGQTVEQARQALLTEVSKRLRDPEISVVLKEFVKPHFVVAGEVASPGRFELRGNISALEAVAMAGGLKNTAKHSQAILYRRYGREMAETRLVNLKQLATVRGINENLELRPDDILFIPQSRISKVERFVRWGSFGIFANPAVR